jgi:phosphatidylglycerol:prolipoprotein diacylglycerol transferase
MEFIEFPKLGIHLDINPSFQIPLPFGSASLTIHWYGVIIAAAIMLALWLAIRDTKKFGLNEDDFIDMFLIALPVSIIFARLFFVVFTWDMYKNDLLGIFRIWEGGLAIYGAIIGAVLSVFIYTRWKKTSMLNILDFACVYLPLAQGIGRWGNFTNQELYGKNTDLPWGMTGSIIKQNPYPGVDPSKLVHPAFLYESILDIIVFVILLRVRKNKKEKGSVFAAYLMLYSFVRFMMEFLRTDEFGTGDIRYNQIVAVLVFAGALIWFIYLKKRQSNAAVDDEASEPSPYSKVLHILDEEEKHEAEKEADMAGENKPEEGSTAESKAEADTMNENEPMNGEESSRHETSGD